MIEIHLPNLQKKINERVQQAISGNETLVYEHDAMVIPGL